MEACDLHVHTGYSTYDGFGSPKQVVERAVALGWGAACLTEHGWLGSAPALYKEARAAKIKPIIGCELYVTPEETLIDGDKSVLAERRHLTVLALSFEGYQNLVTWVNASMQRPAYYNGPRISIDRMLDIAPHPLHHNVVLSGCLGGELCQCLLHANGNREYASASLVGSMATAFPNFYIEIQNHGRDKFMGKGFEAYEGTVQAQQAVADYLLSLAVEFDVPVIVTNDSHYQSPQQRKAHLAMMARKGNRRGGESHRAATEDGLAAGFASQYSYWSSYMQPMERIADTLPKWAAKQAIQSIHDIVEESDVRLDPLDKFQYTMPRSPYKDPVGEIRRRANRRLKGVAATHGAAAIERFEYELQAMEAFAHYLLIYSDIVRMARSQGAYTWTRGSAANSLVNFCLGITEIDPIRYRLIFERFVNPARAKFPDVDIDIEGWRRDDVAKMVKEYMEEVEGEGNVMPVCTYSTLSNRAAFRLMAEAAGVPKEEIDRLAKIIPDMIDSGMVESDEEAYEILREELGIDIYSEAAQVFDSIGGVSQHACAYALGTQERPLSQWVPTYRIGSSNAVVTQFNMKWIEELGFLKLDLLKLDSLAIMHGIARMLGKDMAWLDGIMQTEPGIYDAEDEDTFTLLREGRTEGIHSFQGNTQRRGAIAVGVETIDDLVAVQALYRPSGTRTDSDKTFVNRKHGREDWESLNEVTAKFTDETFGLAIYQEQIMEMGAFMGMTGEEIDDLYKAIKTAKGIGRGAKELFEKFEPTFRKYAKRWMPKQEADQLWAEWEKLQGYCVVGDTVVEKGDGTLVTVKELHDIWHGPITPVRKKYRSRHPKRGLWLTSWRNNGIFLDKCIGIIDNGVKDTWLVTLLDGKTITATANHPLLTTDGWRVVGHLDEGDEVVIDTGQVEPYRDQRTDWSGLAARTAVLTRECAFCGHSEGRLERAHLNHDRTDNSEQNLVMLCNPCHKRHDYKTGRRQGRWSRGRIAGASEVVSIEYAGRQRTYDLVMEGDEHNFVANGIVAHNTFNRGHATSYAILGLKMAYLKAHYPQEFFVSLLDRYPKNTRYLAAAIQEGFTFEPPDINESAGGFSRGSSADRIRVGLLRVYGVGPGAVGEIVRNQPFGSVEDLRERTHSGRVDKTVVENLGRVGALQSLGIQGDRSDLSEYELLGFVLNRPTALRKCRPSVRAREGGSWRFLGLEKGVKITEGKQFVAKMFWLPDVPDNFTTKTSQTGRYNAHLLSAVDENGIPFDITVSEDKEVESKIIKLLAKKCKGAVVTLNGKVNVPFRRGGNTSFSLWGIEGAEDANPQVWGVDEEVAKMFVHLAQAKRSQRRKA